MSAMVAYMSSSWSPDKIVSLFFLQLFADAYPNEEFLPRNSAADYGNDDSDSVE
jgi:hypothetical protein